MKKKVLFLMAAIALFVPSVMASEKTVKDDAELTTAFKTAASGDVIKLTADITDHKGSSNSLRVDGGREITLDLNGHSITTNPATSKNAAGKDIADHRSIVVFNGTLNVIGSGTINHKTHTAINVWGIENQADNKKSVLNVGKDVVLTGDSGIAVLEDSEHAYNTEVNFSGTIKATNVAITISGNVKHADGPIMNIKQGANINASGKNATAVYGAGNGTWNIDDGVVVVGEGSAISIKSGTFNINGGTFTSTGEYVGTPELYGSGINPSGSAIQIETNILSNDNPNGYYGHVKLTINGGDFTSRNGNAILEYGSDTVTAVDSVLINNGSFEAASDKDTIVVSDGLANIQNSDTVTTKPIAISGGYFANGIDNEYIEDGNIVIDFATILDGEITNLDTAIGSIVVPNGTVLDDEAIDELTALIGEEEDGYKLEGYYLDSKLKNKADFTKAFDNDTTIYMSFVKVGTNNTDKKVEGNPKTSDMNIALILSIIGVASLGAVMSYKKKANN